MPVIGERLFEVAHDAVSLLGSRVDRNQIVVMEVDSIRAQFAQFLNHGDRTQTRARRIAKRIAAAIANGPQSKGEFVFRFRLVSVSHSFPFLCSNSIR